MAYTTIDDPSAYFHTQLYTGNGSDDRNITNDANAGDFKPDWLWIKQRSAVRGHIIVDSSRGATLRLRPDESNAEDTKADHIQAFLTDGFQVGTNNTTNVSSGTYVAWQWKCNGGTTTTNDASATSVGTIDSVYQANTTAGFSIVTWTGTGSNGTIAHGLGVVPQLILSKSRGHGENWAVYHQNSNATPEDYYLALDDERANTDSAVVWNDTAPTSSVISIGTQDKINKSGSTHIAYCFNEIKGYSKFGSYTGNGAQNGTFVYTGFKPAFILAKRTDTSGKNWYIADSTRSPNNITKAFLSPNSTAAEDTSGDTTDAYFDILSNGFKMRQDFSHLNASGSTQIYMAFAENPFVSSKGVPTTAR
jgi:hypothetical protein